MALGSFLALLCLFIFPETSAFAQNSQSPITIRNIDGQDEETPVYEVKRNSTQSSNRADDWYRVYVEYDSNPDWIDEITFTFYVRVKGKSRYAPPVSLFKGQTTYIHIPKGKNRMADMFIHPTILERFGQVEAIAVEVRVGGRVLARDGKPRPKNAWWEQLSPTANVLKNRAQTPFALLSLDQQQIVKPASN